jgi:hypothetical protein
VIRPVAQSVDSRAPLAAGRASEIIDLGRGRVLRRVDAAGNPEHEAAMMARARDAGCPVPGVYEVRGDGVVLERIDGPTMAEDARKRPWRFSRHANVLAPLHEDLHRIRMPGTGCSCTATCTGMSPRGPVVIDCANPGAGDAAVDNALTSVRLSTSAGRSGHAFAALLARRVDVRGGLAAAVALRLADRHLITPGRARVMRLSGRGSGEPLLHVTAGLVRPRDALRFKRAPHRDKCLAHE